MSARIGFVGLGNMGEPMVRLLAGGGHDLHVYDAVPAARERLAGIAGVRVARTVTDVADGADAVILMLPDSDVVEAVLLRDGLLRQIVPPTVIVDMSSSVPSRTRALAALAAERDVSLIDAPVSGGVGGARDGSLTIMVGGPAEVVARVRPALDVLGSTVVHAGDRPGAGHAVKALNNLMSGAHLLVSSEALIAGREFGLDPAVMLDIVNQSSGRSGSTQTKWPRFVLPGGFDSGFALRLMLKDMRVALDLERATGTPAPLSQATVDAWAEAAESLGADADHTEIARWLDLRRAAGTGE
jgi:3-hydroxyisobutyrate dehydrogenase